MSPLLNPRPTRNHDPLPATGRAGRNLPAAIGVAVVLIAVVLGSLAFYKVIFVGVVVLAVCGALWELAAAFARKRIRLPLAPLWLGTLGISVCAWEVGAEAAFGAYVATVGACVLWSFMDQAEAEVGTVLEQAGHDIPRTEAHDEVPPLALQRRGRVGLRRHVSALPGRFRRPAPGSGSRSRKSHDAYRASCGQ